MNQIQKKSDQLKKRHDEQAALAAKIKVCLKPLNLAELN